MADTLEADWNRKLRALQEAQQEYEQQRQKDGMAIDEELRTGCIRWPQIFRACGVIPIPLIESANAWPISCCKM